MEQPYKASGGGEETPWEMERLNDTAGKLCLLLSRIADDEEQFYLPEKTTKAAADTEPARRVDTKTLKDVISALKTLTEIVQELRQSEQTDGGIEITLAQEVEHFAN